MQSFRKVVFGISLMIPFLFYLCLRERFEKTSKSLLLLLSSVTFFNPFIRTSSFWGLEENYAIISSLAAILFLLRFIKNGNENFLISFKSIFFVTFFSSLSIYFDQKFIIIPILCFYKIIFSYFSLRTKLTTIFCYSLFSIPYILLIKLWGGIFPTDIYEVGSKFYYNNLGYAFTIVSFIFFPFIFLKSQTIINQILVFLKERNIIILLIPITIYLIFIFFFHNDDFFSNEYDGGGIIKKISLILFSSALYQKIFIFFSFLISWFFIFFFIEKKLFNLFIVLFFLILSFTVSPFYQEYFDPIIFILIFLIFNLDLKLSYKRVYFFYFYFLLFLIGTNAYYN